MVGGVRVAADKIVAAGNAVFTLVGVAQFFQWGNTDKGLLKIRNSNGNIENGFGRAAGYGCAAHMLDVQYPQANHCLDALFLILK
jgi:hypothetical protein